MNVLIACEYSGVVRDAFTALGHNAFSCDLLPTESPGKHYQGNVLDIIAGCYECSCGNIFPESYGKYGCCEKAAKLILFDFIGLHPACTKMALSGNKHYGAGKIKNNERIDAVEWTINLWELACKNANMVYMENPLGAMNGDSRLPKPQIIQPYYFGDTYQKTTCL